MEKELKSEFIITSPLFEYNGNGDMTIPENNAKRVQQYVIDEIKKILHNNTLFVGEYKCDSK
jgi:hypothetical protein